MVHGVLDELAAVRKLVWSGKARKRWVASPGKAWQRGRKWNKYLSLREHTIKVYVQGYNGLWPEARWVDCWACWSPPALPERSTVSEVKRSELYVCFKVRLGYKAVPAKRGQLSWEKESHILSTDVVKNKKAPMSPI